MSEELIIALIQAAIQFGPDVAIALAKLFKTGSTIDDAIAALELARTKTAQQYLDDAKADMASVGSVATAPAK